MLVRIHTIEWFKNNATSFLAWDGLEAYKTEDYRDYFFSQAMFKYSGKVIEINDYGKIENSSSRLVFSDWMFTRITLKEAKEKYPEYLV